MLKVGFGIFAALYAFINHVLSLAFLLANSMAANDFTVIAIFMMHPLTIALVICTKSCKADDKLLATAVVAIFMTFLPSLIQYCFESYANTAHG